MTYSCILIGETTLTVQCGKTLRDAGWDVRRVVTTTENVRCWAVIEKIPCTNPLIDIVAACGDEKVDYIFSVVNPRILPDRVISLARYRAINYHDAPLPRYAGVHATSWAIVHQERVHGVTWHTITPEVDGGSLLLQRHLPVGPRETAYSLNLACYEAAYDLFVELISLLEKGKAKEIPQELTERTYFGKSVLLPRCGIISWYQDALEIDAMVRATLFGPNYNTFGTVKIYSGESYYIVERSRVDDGEGYAPGTIVNISSESFSVQTTRGVLIIEALKTAAGVELRPQEFLSLSGYSCGDRLPEWKEDEGSVAPLLKRARRSEDISHNLLVHFSPLHLFCRTDRSGDAKQHLSASRGEGYLAPVSPCFCERSRLLTYALFCIYLRRLRREDGGDIVMLASASHQGAGLFLSSYKPLSLECRLADTTDQALDSFTDSFLSIYRTTPVEKDLGARSPLLRRIGMEAQIYQSPLCVLLEEDTQWMEQTRIDQIPLLITVQEDGGLQFSYDSARIDAEIFQALLHRFSGFAAEALLRTDVPIGALSLLDNEEAHIENTRLREFKPYSKSEHTILDLLRDQTITHPEAIAARFDGVDLTYRELEERSFLLGEQLSRRGVTRGDIVVVFVEPSFWSLIAPVALWRCGAIVFAIDKNTSSQRFNTLLQESVASLILTDDQELSVERSVLVLTEELLVPLERVLDSSVLPQHSDPALVIFTSGSTGVPKGAILTHRNFVVMLDNSSHLLPLGSIETMIAQSSVNFDLSYFQLFYPLSHGKTVEIVPRAILQDGYLMKDLLERQSSAFFASVPSQIQSLIAAGWRGEGVSSLVAGGEAFSSSLAREIREKVPNVYNVYGPSETTVYVTVYEVKKPGLRANHGFEPLGKVVPFTYVQVVDEWLQPLPAGVPGELLIGGDLVGLGYLRRPELTESRFISKDIEGGGTVRLYRTGDLCSLPRDGYLRFHGRIDHQVKIRGVRVEIDEVRSVLADYPGIQEELVISRKDSKGEKQLIAYIVGTVAEAELQEHLRNHLMPQAIPSAFVFLKSFPLLPSGKIALQELPEPALRSSNVPFIPPRDSTEFRLALIWEEILQCEPVSVLDDFYILGGNSLLAVSLVGKVARNFGVTVPLAHVAMNGTLEKMAETIKSSLATTVEGWNSLVPLNGSFCRRARQSRIYAVHPFGGTVFCYRELARLLEGSCEVVGVQAYGIEEGQRPFYSIESMAEAYVQTIVAQGDVAPVIMGYSFGGLVAFEIARQLEKQYSRYVHLILLDTPGPGAPPEYSGDDDIAFLIDIFSPFCSLCEESIRQAGDRKAQFSHILTTLRQAGVTPPDFSSDQADKFLELYKAHHQAQREYDPQPLNQPFTIMRSEEKENAQFIPYAGDISLGWNKRCAQPIEIITLQGIGHQAILGVPAIGNIATFLKQKLSTSCEDQYEHLQCA
jgi:amino acid adenylation domain-containing protein